MSIENLREELGQLQAALREFEAADVAPRTPMWLTYQSLRARQAQLLTELEFADVDALTVTLLGDPIVAGTVESEFLGEFLQETQAAVSSVAQALRRAPTRTGTIEEPVLASSKMRLAATARSSFKLTFAGPPRAIQYTITGEDQLPLFDVAVARVLDLWDAADDGDEAILRVVGNLGGRAVMHLQKVCEVITGAGASARFSHRSISEPSEVRSSPLPPQRAIRIQEVLSTRSTQSKVERITGMLVGLTWAKNNFDLQVGEGPDLVTYSGDIDQGLRQTADELFDQRVQAVVEITTSWSQAAAEETKTYRIIDLAPAED